MKTKEKALLIDITKCIGCKACEAACREGHGQPAEQPAKLTATSWTFVEEHDGKFVRRMCQHCEEPACASACLVSALKKTELGPVAYEANKCVGCRYCMVACPYQVPKYQWNKLAPLMQKCDMCYDRVSKGEKTRCSEACPTGATMFGDRAELLREAHRRILGCTCSGETAGAQGGSGDPPVSYVPHVYGEHELGGSSVLYLSDVPFEKLGFITPPNNEPMPVLSEAALGDAPTVLTVGGALLAGLYWLSQRRREVKIAEGRIPADGGEERSQS